MKEGSRGGFVESIDAMFPELMDAPEEYIVYMTDGAREAMMLDLIGAGLVKPKG